MDTNELPLRRRTLYPAELPAHISFCGQPPCIVKRPIRNTVYSICKAILFYQSAVSLSIAKPKLSRFAAAKLQKQSTKFYTYPPVRFVFWILKYTKEKVQFIFNIHGKEGKTVKTKFLVGKVFAVLLAVSLCALSLSGCGKPEIKKADTYADEIEGMGIFDSTCAQALPQTIIYKLITEHFAAPLPEGKTVKKAIFLGYDGFRADGLANIKDMDDSGIMYVKSQGGLYHTFSGGISGVNEQATSTAPSWMAMLTGGWAEYNGMDDNGQMKNPDATTFLTEIAETGKAASFTTSWREHTKLSYRPDIIHSIENGLPIEYTHQIDDEGTYYRILKYVSKPAGLEKTAQQDPDVIFFTFEHTDHAGHDTGFGNQNEEYVKGV